MKNQTIEIEKTEGKIGLTAATLPWWARILIAQQAAIAFPRVHSHHLRHCHDCGCVLITTSMACQYFFDRCPECSIKKQKSKGGN